MARPKGAKSDPVGTVFVRVEKDIAYLTKRLKLLRLAKRKLDLEMRLAKKAGL